MTVPVFRSGGSRPSPWASAVTGSSDVSTFTAELASHNQGDRVYFAIVYDGASASPADPTNFAAIEGSIASSSQARLIIYESTTTAPSGGFSDPVLTLTTPEKVACFSWAIAGDATTYTTYGGLGSNSNANPAAITPAGGSSDYLYVAVVGFDGTVTVSSYSSGYDYAQSTVQSNTSNGVTLGICFKAATASSTDDPGAWAHTAEQWGAAVLAHKDNSSPPPPPALVQYSSLSLLGVGS